MLLRTTGKPKNVPIKFCKRALNFFAKTLLTEKNYSEIEIFLKFDIDDLDYEDLGCTEWIDTNLRAREYIITVRPTLGIKTTLVTIAHEMVHVKQYAAGQLIDFVHSSKYNKCRWKEIGRAHV